MNRNEFAQMMVDISGTQPNGRRKLPNDVKSRRHKFNVGDMEGYLIVGEYEDGTPGEMFIKTAKEGTTTSGLLDTIAILTSLGLQNGITTASLAKKLSGTRFEPAGMTGDANIPVATSVVDYIYRYLDTAYGGNPNDLSNSSGMLCPTCHSSASLSGGCLTCANPECGWSRCG